MWVYKIRTCQCRDNSGKDEEKQNRLKGVTDLDPVCNMGEKYRTVLCMQKIHMYSTRVNIKFKFTVQKEPLCHPWNDCIQKDENRSGRTPLKCISRFLLVQNYDYYTLHKPAASFSKLLLTALAWQPTDESGEWELSFIAASNPLPFWSLSSETKIRWGEIR